MHLAIHVGEKGLHVVPWSMTKQATFLPHNVASLTVKQMVLLMTLPTLPKRKTRSDRPKNILVALSAKICKMKGTNG